jgi:hypothetical protein
MAKKEKSAGPTEDIPADAALDAQQAPIQEKAVAVKQENRPSAITEQPYDPSVWGQANLTSRDVIIPRVLLMQPMSPQVTDGKAVFGEFRESLNDEVLGKFENGFDVIPFLMKKVFVESQVIPPAKAGGRPEKKWLRTIDITPENEALPYEGEATLPDTGEVVPVIRDRVMNFYVLLKAELELGGAIPYIISFRRTSMTAGKKMTTQMYMKNINAGKTPASMVMHIFAKKESNQIDGQNVTYAIADVKPVEQTPDRMIAEAFRWLQIVKDGNAKVHEDSYAKEAAGESAEVKVGPVPQEGTGNF